MTAGKVCAVCGTRVESAEDVTPGWMWCPRCKDYVSPDQITDDEKPSRPEEDDKPQRRSQATDLVELATATGAVFFHTPGGECFAGVPVDGHRETIPLRGKPVDTWLRRLYHSEKRGKAPGGSAIQDALGVLRGCALFDGAVEEVFVRVAPIEDGIVIDLGNPSCSVVVVTPAGWNVEADSPVRFRHPRGMLSLPTPQRGGSIEELRPFLNVRDDTDFRLAVTWLVGAMFPVGPYPGIVLNGEQGAAKTTVARVMRSLIDPNGAATRSAPRDERDLVIAANNSWIVSLDNLSGLPAWLSDALCRLATGGGFSTRMLYENDEEMIFDSQRPIILNGIADIAARGDLADRSLVLTLPAISSSERRTEGEFWGEFENARPRIIGALLDVLSATLRALPSTTLTRHPRMADFALRGAAMAHPLGWTPEGFLSAYEASRHTAEESVLDASIVTDYILKVREFTGTASELLIEVESLSPESVRRSRQWPGTAQRLSNEVRRLAPALRGQGVEVEFDRTGKRRIITIREAPDEAVTAVTGVTPDTESMTPGDGTVTPGDDEASPGSRYEDDACDASDASQRSSSNGHLVEAAADLGLRVIDRRETHG